MGQEYGFKTITTRHETLRLGNTTVDFKTITRAGEKDQDDAFHDFKLEKESGQKTLLHTSAFPQVSTLLLDFVAEQNTNIIE